MNSITDEEVEEYINLECYNSGNHNILTKERAIELLIKDKQKIEIMNYKKTLGNTTASGATKNVKDIVFWGNGDTFSLISKASSENEGWMKSTKAMQAGKHVVVQVTTQQRNSDGSYSIAEALTTVENSMVATITTDKEGKTHEIVGCKIPEGHTAISRIIIQG